MSVELDANFVAAIRTYDADKAKNLMETSGLSNPNTWFSQYQLIAEIAPQRLLDIMFCSGSVYDIFALLLGQMEGRVLMNIFRAAVKDRQYELIQMLMAVGMFKTDVTDENGNTPLHIMIQEGGFYILPGLLLGHMAGINAKNNEGSAAIHLAAPIDKTNWAVHRLLAAGADCDIQDNLGRTALHLAVINGNQQVVAGLLKHGADINITCNDNLPALHYERDSSVLKQHIVWMKSLNLDVSQANVDLVNDVIVNSEDSQRYEKQIAVLKANKINKTNVSFYELLTCSMNQLAFYAGDRRFIRSRTTRKEWYDSFVDRRMRLGKKRNCLLKQSLESIDIATLALVGAVFPECDISMAILHALSDKDLESLIEATSIAYNVGNN